MLGILISAVVLGAIIAAMEGDMPDLLPLLGSVILMLIGQFLGAFLGVLAFGESAVPVLIVSAVGGAISGGLGISWLCGMEVKRAALAATIHLVVTVGIRLTLGAALG